MTFATGDAMVSIFFNVLIAPLVPAFTFESGKKFEIGAGRTGLNQVIDFVWFSGMLSFSRAQ
jgi:hypothetical protein